MNRLSAILALLLAALAAAPGAAQPPIPPAVVARDGNGHVTVRATRIAEPLTIDGKLDEDVYRSVAPFGDFVQQEPREGEPSTERTEAWIFFDERNLYVAARCWDTHPEREVANDMRRDGQNIRFNDNFGLVLDTFHDQRNGFMFYTNPLGAMFDSQTTDEPRTNNWDWNTIWNVKTARSETGWTAEFSIPFKSLRYRPGDAQVWGINLRRVIRWKNEWTYLRGIPASFGPIGIVKVSHAATLVGIETPPGPKNLEIKPYAISRLTTDRLSTPPRSNAPDADAGFDVKYGLTRGLTADVTLNTDFAQVEDDETQVNLTRFGLFFPEKREFFLESAPVFVFGGSGQRSVGGPGSGGGGGQQGSLGGSGAANVPLLFFSRQIGLHEGQTVPVTVGGKVTGKVGSYGIGLLDIQTGDDVASGARATNFSVLRVRRDILRNSNVGAMFTRRSVSLAGAGANQAFGVDSTLALGRDLFVNSFLARTDTPGFEGDDLGYRVQLDYNADRYGLQIDRLAVGEHFRPEIGFAPRLGFRRNFAGARFSPRPAHITSVRRFGLDATFDYTTDKTGALESRELQSEFRTEFQTSDVWRVEYTRSFESLKKPFDITKTVSIPVGGYSFQNLLTSYMLGQQRKVSGSVTAERGTFYGGDKTAASFRGRVEVTSQMYVEPVVSINRVVLPYGRFTTWLFSARTTYTFTPRMFAAALVQYNSSTSLLTSNVRLRWEYRPGSELFVVYSEGRDTLLTGRPELQNRGFVVKINRLLRF